MSERDERDDLGVDRADLDAWEALEPSPGFAERVVERARTAKDEPRVVTAGKRPQPFMGTVAAAFYAAVAAAAITFFVVSPSERSLAGEGRAEIVDARREVELGGRAVAVGEPGAALSWRVDDEGTAEIEQTRGDVFYRVAPGGAFEVTTPAGTVSVLGTCFRVEVIEMRRTLTGAAIGAALAAVAVVTVYEGGVAVASGDSRAEVSAGEQAILRPGEAPLLSRARAGAMLSGTEAVEPIPENASREDLAHQIVALRAERGAREQRVAELEARLEALGVDADGLPVSLSERRFWPPTDAELRVLSDSCTVRVDSADVTGVEPELVDDEAVEKLGLASAERPVVDDAIRRLHESYSERIRGLYVEATGDTAGAAALSPRAMLAEIRDKAPEGESGLMARIARERAGLEAPPTDLSNASANERAVRLYLGLGDELERTLASTLGADRTRELRTTAGGWPWQRSEFSGCSRR